MKHLRESAGLPQWKLAASLDIDTATYSKIETGNFIPNREQVVQIAHLLLWDESELLELWMAEKTAAIVESDMTLAPVAIKLVGENLNIE